MITSTLLGGLGNQMFQYAAGRALALRNRTSLRLDLGWFEHRPARLTPRRYELDCFQIEAELCSIYPPTRAERVREILRLSPRVHTESTFRFDPRTLELPDHVRLVGYWVNERYFEDFSAQVREDFSFREPPLGRNEELADQISATNAVSVHVRRTDYVTNGAIAAYHGALSPDYYSAAAARIREGLRDPHFYVFSDDPDWCRANLDLGGSTTYVDHNRQRGAEDMRLMSMCSHHIIANSSFSWWGAWLGSGEDAIVIAPTEWVADGSVDTADVVPAGWLRL